MDINAFMTAIGSVGFPIVACCYMFYLNQKQTEQHAAETKSWTEALTELKIAIVSLTDKLNDK